MISLNKGAALNPVGALEPFKSSTVLNFVFFPTSGPTLNFINVATNLIFGLGRPLDKTCPLIDQAVCIIFATPNSSEPSFTAGIYF